MFETGKWINLDATFKKSEKVRKIIGFHQKKRKFSVKSIYEMQKKHELALKSCRPGRKKRPDLLSLLAW